MFNPDIDDDDNGGYLFNKNHSEMNLDYEIFKESNLIISKIEEYIEERNFLAILYYLEDTQPMFLKRNDSIKYKLLKYHYFDLIQLDKLRAKDFFRTHILPELKTKRNFNRIIENFKNFWIFVSNTSYFQAIFSNLISKLKYQLRSSIQSYFNSNMHIAELGFHTLEDGVRNENDDSFDEIIDEIEIRMNKNNHNLNSLDQYKEFIDSEYKNHIFSFTPHSKFVIKKESDDCEMESFLENKTQHTELKNALINHKGEECEVSNLITSSNVDKKDSLASSQIKYTREKINPKHKIPFLKEFNPKFTKRENIDKKIMRKFRKFLAVKHKQDKTFFNNFKNKRFWMNFINEGIYPPVKYCDEDSIFEFKSFNTSYIIWIFSHENSNELYDMFVEEKAHELIFEFRKKHEKAILSYDNDEKIKIIKHLDYYVYNYSKLYNFQKKNEENFSQINQESNEIMNEDVHSIQSNNGNLQYNLSYSSSMKFE